MIYATHVRDLFDPQSWFFLPTYVVYGPSALKQFALWHLYGHLKAFRRRLDAPIIHLRAGKVGLKKGACQSDMLPFLWVIFSKKALRITRLPFLLQPEPLQQALPQPEPLQQALPQREPLQQGLLQQELPQREPLRPLSADIPQ